MNIKNKLIQEAVEQERYQLYNGDCLEVMDLLPNDSVDLILCDLPYGTTSCTWDSIIPFDLLWKQYNRVIKPNSAIVLTASQPFTSNLVMSNPSQFKVEWIWDKMKGTNFATVRFFPMKEHESVLIFSKGKCPFYPIFEQRRGKPSGMVGKSVQSNSSPKKDSVINIPAGNRKVLSELRVPRSIQEFPRKGRGNIHPTQKPVDLMSYFIRTYSLPGETVLDNCMGSGTTGEACLDTGRKFIGIEKDDLYFRLAQKRISEHFYSIYSDITKK